MVRIPTEYQEVEYIQGTSNARIDTGVPGNNDDLVISGKVYLNKFSAYQGIFSNYIDEDHNTSRLIMGATANGVVIANINRRAGSSSVTQVGFYAGNMGEFKVSKTKLIFNGTEYSYGGVNNATANDTNILLNVNNPATTTSNSVLYRRWYYFRINDGDTALRNYIPCYRKSDSKPGMYDTVTNQFFASSGTEEFIVGNDVSWDTASLIERRRQILLNTPHLETISDTMVSFKTDVPASVKDCKVYFSPVQDLHGYSNSWPAGGGKNLWGGLAMANGIASATGVTVDTNNKTVSITTGGTEAVLTSGIKFKENTQYTFILDASTYSGHANLMFVYTDGTNDRGLGRYMDTGANVSAPGKTVQSIVKRSYSNTTIINYETSGLFEGVKTANDYEPYENICPITGWDGVTVIRCGKSFYEPLDYEQYVNGTARQYWGTNVGVIRDAINKLPKGRQYSIIFDFKVNSVNASATNIEYGMQLAGTGYSGGRTRIVYSDRTVNQVIHTKCSFFLNKNANITHAYFYASGDSVILQNFMIIEGNTDSTYEPYTRISLTIPFPQTIYGGYVDLVKGEVVAEKVFLTMNGSETAWETYGQGNYPGFRYLLTNAKIDGIPSQQIKSNWLTASSLRGNRGSTNQYTIYTYSGTTGYDAKYIFVCNVGTTDLTEFKAMLTESPLQICYPLSTPITYQLTPETIKTLKGTNNIWSNANGNIEVKFWKH